MQIDQIPKLKSQIQKIGFYQVIGGIIGIIFLLISFFGNGDFSGVNILVYTLMLLFFGYSIFCGTLCLSFKENALRHSLVNQFLQIVAFAILGFAFSYIAGVRISIGLDLSNSPKITFGAWLSGFDININREFERTEIKFNLVAVALSYLIYKLQLKLKRESTLQSISLVTQD